MKRKILDILETVILIVTCLACIFVLLQKFVFKDSGVFGYRAYVIVTSSMEPSLKIGDVILVKKVNPNKIKIGDIVTYNGMESDFAGKIITHQVHDIAKEKSEIDKKTRLIFYTKGTTNNMVDPAVYEEQLCGKVIYKIKILSFLSKIIRSKYGYIFIVFIPLVLIFVKEMITIKKKLS